MDDNRIEYLYTNYRATSYYVDALARVLTQPTHPDNHSFLLSVQSECQDIASNLQLSDNVRSEIFRIHQELSARTAHHSKGSGNSPGKHSP